MSVLALEPGAFFKLHRLCFCGGCRLEKLQTFKRLNLLSKRYLLSRKCFIRLLRWNFEGDINGIVWMEALLVESKES